MSQKDSRIIKASPAPYPKTNTPEFNSVVTFIKILNKNRVKPEVNILDKVPNTDGIFEVVTENQVPIGKLDVQIKILSKSNLKNPKYQCKKDFLAYCEESLLPVLLIVVDTKSEIAYWVHIDRDLLTSLSKKIKGASVSVKIPKENIISESNDAYVSAWEEILEDYRTRLINYSAIKEELDTRNQQYEELRRIANPALGIDHNDFREIHLFLDYYNNLLDGDFKIVKSTYYKDCWKFGIAYSHYSENSLHYSRYPIRYTSNDIQIKHIDEETAHQRREFLGYSWYSSENPIKKRPKEYAYEYIIEDLKKIVDGRLILPIDSAVATEYIFSFLDRFHPILGMPKHIIKLDLNDLEYGLRTFLPVFLEVGLADANRDLLNVNIDIFRWHFLPDDIRKIVNKTQEKLDNGYKFQRGLRLTSKDFNLRYLKILMEHLKLKGKLQLQRPYPIKKRPEKERSFIWEVYTASEVKNIIQSIYEKLPELYNTFVKEYFPELFSKIHYFSGFNRMIINLSVNENAIDYKDGPGIEVFYLKNIHDETEKRIDVFLSDVDKLPITWRGSSLYSKKTLMIGSSEYRLISAFSSVLDNIYHDTPLQDYLFDTLKKRLEAYLKPFTKEVNIFRFTRY